MDDIPALFRQGAARGLRIVGDVHGDLNAFRHAAQTDRFLLQLGDLVDDGPDSAGVLRLMFELIEQSRGCFVLGNHDLRLARALAGRIQRLHPVLDHTLAGLDPPLRARAAVEFARAPAWLRLRHSLFVHGGFHTLMLEHASPFGATIIHGPVRAALGRAMYGEVTGATRSDGSPQRSLRWVDRIPAGLTVYCGHDRRSTDGRPYHRNGKAGGLAVFMDTGAGKGGHLSWLDLDAEAPATGPRA